MRFFVEVTTAGGREKDTVCVEADSWQRALQSARSLRGDDGTISGFAIELREDGCRAVDPMTRSTFEVTRAPDDAPLTGSTGPSAARSAAPQSRAVAPAAGRSAPPPAKGAAPKGTAASAKGAPSTPRSAASKSAAPPRPVKGSAGTTTEGSHAGPAPKAPGSAPLPTAEAIGAGAPSQTVTTELTVLVSREQGPTDASPITYREYVFALTPGTAEETAAGVLRTQLEVIKASMATVVGAKLVNLAAFDVVFKGKPPVAPLATLTWKDWRGDPVIAFPRRGGPPASLVPGAPPPSFSVPAGPESAPPVRSQPPPAPPVRSQPPPAQPVRSQPPPAPPARSQPPPATPGAIVAAPVVVIPSTPSIPVDLEAPADAAIPPPPGFAAPVAAPQPAPPVPAFPPQPAPAAAPSASAQPAPAAAPSAAQPAPAAPAFPPQPAFPTHAGDPFAPPPAFPAQPGAPVATQGAPPSAAPPAGAPTRSSSIPPSTGRASRPGGTGRFRSMSRSEPRISGVRAAGDDLLTDLFEAMHDLHFLGNALEGADFVLELALAKLPCRAAFVHFYDLSRREFVVACTKGKGTSSMLLDRHSDGDPLLAAAMKKRRAVVVREASGGEAESLGRFAALASVKSVMSAPVMMGGRFLGAIELMNPTDDDPFTEGDGEALTYIGEQFAEFLSSRGVILDSEAIARGTQGGPPGRA